MIAGGGDPGHGNCISYSVEPIDSRFEKNKNGITTKTTRDKDLTTVKEGSAWLRKVYSMFGGRDSSRGPRTQKEYTVRTYAWKGSDGEVNVHAARIYSVPGAPAGSPDAWSDRRGPEKPIYSGYDSPDTIPGIPEGLKDVVVQDYYLPRPN